MLMYIIGKITYISDKNYIILENNFNGYKINVSNPDNFTIDKIKKIYIYNKKYLQNNFIVNELYGFLTIKEKMFFEKLLTISGIGPKTAIGIMENDVDLIEQLISNQDVDNLCLLPNITKKIATILTTSFELDVKVLEQKNGSIDKSDYKLEIISALKNLGYKKAEINYALDHINFDMKQNESNNFMNEKLTDFLSNAIKIIAQRNDKISTI